MEIPARLNWWERGLGIVLLALVLAAAGLERRSPTARALRAPRPCLLWLRLSAPAGPTDLFAAVYAPPLGRLVLLYVPSSARPSLPPAFAALDPMTEQGSFSAAWRPERSDDPSLAAKSWATGEARSPRFWLALARAHLKEARPGALFDALLLFLELRRLSPDEVRPAWLSADDPAALAGLIEPEPDRSSQSALTVEVLNGSGQKGLAWAATKILRSNGVDVVSVGNLPARQARTVVYDRVGRYALAAALGRQIGCPAARTATQLNPKKLIDATIMLGEDCSHGTR